MCARATQASPAGLLHPHVGACVRSIHAASPHPLAYTQRLERAQKLKLLTCRASSAPVWQPLTHSDTYSSPSSGSNRDYGRSRETERESEREGEKEREREREREREKSSAAESREREGAREKESEKEREREAERKRAKERARERGRERVSAAKSCDTLPEDMRAGAHSAHFCTEEADEEWPAHSRRAQPMGTVLTDVQVLERARARERAQRTETQAPQEMVKELPWSDQHARYMYICVCVYIRV